MVQEISRLLPKLPAPKIMGITESDKARFCTAAKHAANFTIQQMKQITYKSQTYINYRLAAGKKEDSAAITDWIEEILDASKGYKKAHDWTRSTSKAPPLATHMWRKGKYVSNPHEMGEYLLQDWGKIWTKDIGENMLVHMWEKIKQLIQASKAHKNEMEKISTEDVKKAIKSMSSATAVGIDQWSPAHLKKPQPRSPGCDNASIPIH